MRLAARVVAAARTASPRAPSDDPSLPDERNDLIARLELEIAAERIRTEELLATVKALEFELEVLERSYSKQLADARAHTDAVNQEATELKARLTETTAELKTVTATRDRLHDMFSFDGRRIPPELRGQQGDDDTIGRLMSAERWTQDAASSDELDSTEEARSEHEPPPKDLLAPDLVFDRDDEDDSPRRSSTAVAASGPEN